VRVVSFKVLTHLVTILSCLKETLEIILRKSFSTVVTLVWMSSRPFREDFCFREHEVKRGQIEGIQ